MPGASEMTVKDSTVAILSRKESADIRDVTIDLIEKLNSAGFNVYSGVTIDHKISDKVHTINELKELDLDIIVTIGGDGSLLWAIREMDNETPVLGINVGGRGILAEVKPDEIDEAVEKLKSKEYIVENRQKLIASFDSISLPPALNEIYINRISEIRTSTFNLSIENYLIKQKMDGIMISTSTGSTGHSLSFGGSFIHPDPTILQILPVGSINRLPSMIIPTHPIEISSDHDSVLVIDGQEEFVVKAFKKVHITKHERYARFIRLKKKSMRQLENLGF
jgi:NAD+ kinase